MTSIQDYQEMTLKALKDKVDDFYLAGGTALSLFYFQHRISVDLDFFTRQFSAKRIREIIAVLRESLKKEIRLIGQNQKEAFAKIMVYNIYFKPSVILKLDFVEDFVDLIKEPKRVEGVRVLSLEDIYMRKIFAVCGVSSVLDEVGRKKSIGHRMDAKDFYDLYFLSHTFMPLSRFSNKYCDAVAIEGLVRWFRTYDRIAMIDGLLSVGTDKKIDYKKMERHFKEEIDKVMERETGNI